MILWRYTIAITLANVDEIIVVLISMVYLAILIGKICPKYSATVKSKPNPFNCFTRCPNPRYAKIFVLSTSKGWRWQGIWHIWFLPCIICKKDFSITVETTVRLILFPAELFVEDEINDKQ